MAITIEQGVTLGQGVTIDSGPGFTLSPSDFTNAYWGSYININGSSGFTTTNAGTGPGEAFYGPILSVNNGGNITKLNEIRAYWSNNSLTVNNTAYMFNVTWGPGSTSASGVVVMQFQYYNDNNTNLSLGVVDTSNANYLTPYTGYYNGPIKTLAGTWNLPASFSVITPLIPNNNNWC